MGDDERRVPGGPAALAVRELDADRAFALRRDRYRAAVDELFDAIRGDSRFDVAFDRAVARDLLDLAPGGLDELCALLTVTEALFPPGAAPPAHDLVVVDTAPTGHTLRLLALPGLALDWVRALLATLLKYREVLALGALATDLVELSRGLRQLEALLRDAHRARAVVVTRAAALPRLETIRLLGQLDRLGLAVSAIVVNALTPADVSGAPEVTRAEAAEVRRLRAASRPRVGQPPLPPGAGYRPTAARRRRPRGVGTDVDPGGLVEPAPAGQKPARSVPAADGRVRGDVRVLRRAERQGPGSPDGPTRAAEGTGKPRAIPAEGGLWLIVADAPLPQYGEPALARLVRDLDAVSRCAVAHSAVIAHCARRGPTLPLRLLTLFSSDARALAEVRRRRRSLERRLTHVAGRAEWGVQARFDAARRRRARRAGGAARPAAPGEGPGRRFLERARRQRDETRGLAADARTAATSLYRALARYADDARQRPPVSVDGRPALLLDAAFLVARTRIRRGSGRPCAPTPRAWPTAAFASD